MRDIAAFELSTTEDSVNTISNSLSTEQSPTLRDSVAKALNNYFSQLDGQAVTNVYEMVISEIEAPLMEAVLAYTQDNQTKSAQILGLNRGTLRKKLKQYGLLNSKQS